MAEFDRAAYLERITQLDSEQLIEALLREAELRYRYQEKYQDLRERVDLWVGSDF